jgi:hypothetical protein
MAAAELVAVMVLPVLVDAQMACAGGFETDTRFIGPHTGSSVERCVVPLQTAPPRTTLITNLFLDTCILRYS